LRRISATTIANPAVPIGCAAWRGWKRILGVERGGCGERFAIMGHGNLLIG
jgi:hypothetical protein